MMLGPLLLAAIEGRLGHWFGRAERRPFDAVTRREDHVLIAGFGRFGQIVGRVLRARHIPFTALDSSPGNIDFVRRFGNEVYYGDATRLDMLRAAGAERASAFVLAVDDVDASVRTAQIVRQHFPQLRLFARARSRQHAFRLMEVGVHRVIRETYASSLEMAVGVLEALGETAATARSTVRRFREHDEAMLERQFAVRDDDSKLIASAQESARQLEQLFESDNASAAEPPTAR
jgi:glutathione-regulated potassium-efflux system ancillary protein KefC/glutathione-regulated potassium-efflux system protein KefB